MKDLLDTIALIGSMTITIIVMCFLGSFVVNVAIYIFSNHPQVAILTTIIAFGVWCLNRTYKILKSWAYNEP